MFLFSLGLAACGGPEEETVQTWDPLINNGGSGASSLTNGDKCEVTSGPNKGKTGTYNDGWCEGDWGGTECGTDKCKEVTRTIYNPPVVSPPGGGILIGG